MKYVMSLIGLMILMGCSSSRPQFGSIDTSYDKDFDLVWASALVAVSEMTVENSNKEAHQIVASNDDGSLKESVVIKISQARPYTVMVRAQNEKQYSTGRDMGFGNYRMTNRTRIRDNKQLQEKVLNKIDEQLR